MSTIPTHEEVDSLERLATIISKTRKGKNSSEGENFVTLMMAHQLGMPLMAAATGGINNVKGNIELGAHSMAALIRRAGGKIKILENSDVKCSIYGKRKDGGEYTSTFTIEDAKKAGLVSGPWTSYPADMLYTKCISRLGRILFPDVFGIPVYSAGEISGEEVDQKELAEVRLSQEQKEEEQKEEEQEEEQKEEEQEEEQKEEEQKEEEQKEEEQEEKKDIPLGHKILHLYKLFPGQDEDFSTYVAEAAKKRNTSTEEMYAIMYDHMDAVNERFRAWQELREEFAS